MHHVRDKGHDIAGHPWWIHRARPHCRTDVGGWHSIALGTFVINVLVYLIFSVSDILNLCVLLPFGFEILDIGQAILSLVERRAQAPAQHAFRLRLREVATLNLIRVITAAYRPGFFIVSDEVW